MQRSTSLFLTLGIIASVAVVGASVSQGASSATQCWDEYNANGTQLIRTVTARGVAPNDCTPGEGCFDGYRASDGRKDRLYVPRGASPATACVDLVPSTTIAPTPTTTPGNPSTGRFATLAVGAELPSDADCAATVRPAAENRPENTTANSTMGTQPNGRFPRVTGAFTGTTDEIIQWTACKWGIDEDIVRAQIVVESYWIQDALGDYTEKSSACAPTFPIGSTAGRATECPESVGLGQVRWTYHQEAFEDNNAILSSAYNLDYTYAVFRSCFEGDMGWLNNVSGRGDYAAGDLEGCLGAWFSGRWHTPEAETYITKVNAAIAKAPWQQPGFSSAVPPSNDDVTPTTVAPVTTVTPTTTVTSTIAATTTTVAPTTTVASTIAPPTTSGPTPTTAPDQSTPSPDSDPGSSTAAFIATFDNNSGLDQFDRGVWHRDADRFVYAQWSGDHDLNCGGPDTQRTIHRDNPDDSIYACKNHVMMSIGDTSGYSMGWLSPKQTFTADQRSVSVDVNVTDLGSRQWIEIGMVPANYDSGHVGCELCFANHSAVDQQFGGLPNDSFVFGNAGGNSRIMVNYRGDRGLPRVADIDPEGKASKAIRRTWTATDNGDGTVTIGFNGKEWTKAGSFPSGDWKLIIKDHNYRPTKDGPVVGFTWHLDNIIVK